MARHPLNHIHLTLIGGILFSLVLSWLIGVLANRPALLEKKVEQRTAELHTAEIYAQTIFNSVQDALLIHHPENGDILDFNRTAEEMFGISREQIGTITIGDLSAGSTEMMQAEGREIVQRAAHGFPQVFEWAAKHANGKIFPVEVSISAAQIGSQTRVIACTRDISKRKQTEQDLQQNIAELRRFNKAAVGREYRMIELKQEVNGLCRELGRKEPYPLHSTA